MRWLFLLLLTVFVGCASRPACEPRTVVQVPTAPPMPLEEADSKSPVAPGMSWIAGHWHWDGLRWVWSPSHWASTPPGQRWYPPRYAETAEGRHLYRPGAFGCIEVDKE